MESDHTKNYSYKSLFKHIAQGIVIFTQICEPTHIKFLIILGKKVTKHYHRDLYQYHSYEGKHGLKYKMYTEFLKTTKSSIFY